MATLLLERPHPRYKGSARPLQLRGNPYVPPTSRHAFTYLPRDRRVSIHTTARTYCRNNNIPKGAHRMPRMSPRKAWKVLYTLDTVLVILLVVFGVVNLISDTGAWWAAVACFAVAALIVVSAWLTYKRPAPPRSGSD